DALDHTANESLVGGKLGVDATGDIVQNGVDEILDDETLLQKFQTIDNNIVELKQYFTHTKNPITVITLNKTSSVMGDIEKFYPLKKHIKLLVVVDKKNNDINDPYMLIWRVVNNIDASRDVILNPFIIIDGTNKSEVDGFNREWPNDTFCTKEVLDSLQERGLINIDNEFIKRFGLLPFD
ncbi:MAG: UbiD family decarboxylase, partial [Sulfurovaceae bacterium]|nr:UbiD family decarboxylase [Sulfurovaceae bacterium]